MHPITWFEDRIGQTIIRKRPDPISGVVTSYVHLKDQKTCNYHFDMQEHGHRYEAKVTIHRKPFTECESCSA